METFLNFISNNASAFLSLLGVFITCFTTVIISIIGVLIYKANLKSSRTSSVVEELVKNKIESCNKIKQFITEYTPINNTYVNDFKECQLIWINEDKLVPGYYRLFENIESLEKYKLELEKIINSQNTLSSSIEYSLNSVYSFINSFILIYKKYPNSITNNKWILSFISRDFYKFLTLLMNQISINYISTNFESYEKESRKRKKIQRKFIKAFFKTAKNSPSMIIINSIDEFDFPTFWDELKQCKLDYFKSNILKRFFIILSMKLNLNSFILKFDFKWKYLKWKCNSLNIIRNYDNTYKTEYYKKIFDKYNKLRNKRINSVFRNHYLKYMNTYDKLEICRNCKRWLLLFKIFY